MARPNVAQIRSLVSTLFAAAAAAPGKEVSVVDLAKLVGTDGIPAAVWSAVVKMATKEHGNLAVNEDGDAVYVAAPPAAEDEVDASLFEPLDGPPPPPASGEAPVAPPASEPAGLPGADVPGTLGASLAPASEPAPEAPAAPASGEAPAPSPAPASGETPSKKTAAERERELIARIREVGVARHQGEHLSRIADQLAGILAKSKEWHFGVEMTTQDEHGKDVMEDAGSVGAACLDGAVEVLRAAAHAYSVAPLGWTPPKVSKAKGAPVSGKGGELAVGTQVYIRAAAVKNYAGLLEDSELSGLLVVAVNGKKVVCKTTAGSKVILSRGDLMVG